MIDIYLPTNTNFDNNGDMTLFPTKAPFTAELNGSWVLDLVHPIDQEGRWKYIQEEGVISVPTWEGRQLFRIDKCVKTDTEITVTAYPIFFDSGDDCFLMDVRPTSQNGQQALDTMMAGSKYSGSSDITTGATAYFVRRNLMDAINGESDPTFVKVWGGEIIFNNFQVIINEKAGSNNGVEIRYGKNMDGISYTVDMSNVITRIVPVGYNGKTLSTQQFVDSPLISNYAKIYTREVTFDNVRMADDAGSDDSSDIIICQTDEEFDQALIEQCNLMYQNGADLPEVNIQTNMVLLSKTDQYKDFQMLEEVGLGDVVNCINSRIGISTQQRVIKLVWDCLKDKPDSVELGEFEFQYFDDLTASLTAVSQVIGPGNTVVAERVQGVLNAINTQLRYQKNIAQTQDVRAILFEDTDPDSPTYGAMCLGTQGFQISDQRTADGSDWDWTTAFTAKGGYANTLVAGIISDKTGESYWDLDNGDIVIKGTIISSSAQITGGSFNVQTSNSYDSRVSLNAQQSGMQYKTALSPIYLESYWSNGNQVSWVSGALGVLVGNYSGTIDNPGAVTPLSQISGGDITCQHLTQTSDARMKEDIEEIPEDMAEKIIMSAKPKSFRFKGEDGVNLGFIAQDVEEILGEGYNLFTPEKEIEGIKTKMSVSYIDFIAPLVKMVQSMKLDIEKLKGGAE